MNLFFECAIKHPVSSEDAKQKKFLYLLESESYTEAEKSCYTIMNHLGFNNFSIEKITKTDINEVFVENASEDSRYYSVKLATAGVNEETGEEITVNKYHYNVFGTDIEPVARFVKGVFSVDDVIILQQKRTNITEYYSRESIRQMEQSVGLTPVSTEPASDDI